MKRPLLRNISVFVLMSLLVTGCWDTLELEKRLIVASLTLDKSKEGYELNVQVPIPTLIVGGGEGGGGGIGGGGSGGSGPVQNFNGTGKTLSKALSQIQNQNSLPLFYGYTLTVLFGEKLAREGIANTLDTFRRNPEIRRQLWPVVVQGEAKKALKVETKLEQIPTYYLKNMLESNQRSGRIPASTLGDFFINISNDYMEVPLLNYIKPMKNTFMWSGVAVFNKDRMIGLLNKEETSVLVQLREQKNGWSMEVPCPVGEGKMVFRPTGVKRKFTISKEHSVEIDINVDGELAEKSCGFKMSDSRSVTLVEREVAKGYEREAKALIAKAQNDFKLDIFLIGRYVHAYHPAIWERRDWQAQFRDMPVRVKYNIKLERMGLEAE